MFDDDIGSRVQHLAFIGARSESNGVMNIEQLTQIVFFRYF